MLTSNFYVSLDSGQIHIVARGAPDSHSNTLRPLVCLHPSPSSGQFFVDFLNAASEQRWVLAPDTPGFGNSFRPDSPPEIVDYGRWLAAALQRVDGLKDGFDLLGFHTGCFIAAEVALTHEGARDLILPGIPYFPEEDRQRHLAATAQPPAYLATPESLGTLWAKKAEGLPDNVKPEDYFAIWAEELRSAPNGWWGFRAVFTYAAESRLAALRHRTLAIADRGLNEPTKRAAELIPNAELWDRPEWRSPLFSAHVPELITALNSWCRA